MNQASHSAGYDPDTSSLSQVPWYLNPVLWFLVLAAVATVWVSWSAFEYPMAAFRYGSDYWEHSAAIAEWQKDLWNPANPHLPIDAGTPRYMPFFFVLTVVSKWFVLDPIDAMAVGATINMVLLSLGVWLFFGLYFRNQWAPVVGFILFTCGWGLGWIFSNLFQLRGLFFVASYPSLFVFSLSLVGWWQVARLVRGDSRGFAHYAALALLTALMLVSHPLTGAFALGTMMLMTIFEPGAAWKTRSALVVSIIVGALLTEFWPYFSTWEVVTARSGGEETSWVERGAEAVATGYAEADAMQPRQAALDHNFYDPFQVILTLGPALFGLPAMLTLLAKRRHLFIVTGFAGATAIYLLNLFFPVPLGHRFLLYAVVYLHLALTWWILGTAPAWRATFVIKQQTLTRNGPVLVTGIFIGTMLLWNAAVAALQFVGYQAFPHRGILERYTYLQPVLRDIRAIANALPDESVVIGDPMILWPLPTFSGKTVAMYHPDPMVPDLGRRRADAFRFLNANTSTAERLAIIDNYGVTHILYKLKPQKDIAEELNALGEIAFKYKGFVLIKLHSEDRGEKPMGNTSREDNSLT